MIYYALYYDMLYYAIQYYDMLCRSIHLKCNPDYAQFISSASNAVVVVKVLNARMCDINDRVTYWSSKDGIVPNL